MNGESNANAGATGVVDGNSHPSDLPVPADRKLVRLGVIRSWPEGMQVRVEHVWRDLVGFTIDYKLYDLSRVLAEFGFELEVRESASGMPGRGAGNTGTDGGEVSAPTGWLVYTNKRIDPFYWHGSEPPHGDEWDSYPIKRKVPVFAGADSMKGGGDAQA